MEQTGRMAILESRRCRRAAHHRAAPDAAPRSGKPGVCGQRYGLTVVPEFQLHAKVAFPQQGDLLLRLIDGVVDLLEVDASRDVERRLLCHYGFLVTEPSDQSGHCRSFVAVLAALAFLSFES